MLRKRMCICSYYSFPSNGNYFNFIEIEAAQDIDQGTL